VVLVDDLETFFRVLSSKSDHCAVTIIACGDLKRSKSKQ
jgi:hypothetical protein